MKSPDERFVRSFVAIRKAIMMTKNDSGAPRSAKAPAGAGRQAIEGNSLMQDEIEMFAMFEREWWSPEQQCSHILSIFADQPSDQ